MYMPPDVPLCVVYIQNFVSLLTVHDTEEVGEYAKR